MSLETLLLWLKIVQTTGLILLILLILELIFFPLKVACSKQVITRTTQSIISQRIGSFMSLFYLTAVLFSVLGGNYSAWAHFIPTLNLMTAGVLILLVFVPVLGFSLYALGNQLNSNVQIIQGQKLITNGPYAVVRHPCITAFFLANVGAVALTGYWFCFVAYLPVLVHNLCLIPLEEQTLLEEFGKEYQNYRDSTGMLWPNLFKAFAKYRKLDRASTSEEQAKLFDQEKVVKRNLYGSAPALV
jgi:protein-S-isoprenylcysteine O-methyltransferase Ste14